MTAKRSYPGFGFRGGKRSCDVGTSGRSPLELAELHRFPNIPVRLENGLYWDTLRLFHEMCEGIRIAGKSVDQLDGIAVGYLGSGFSGC